MFTLKKVFFFLLMFSSFSIFSQVYTLEDICRTYSGPQLTNICRSIPFCSVYKFESGCIGKPGSSDLEIRMCDSFNDREDFSLKDKKLVCKAWGHVCDWIQPEGNQTYCSANRNYL